MPPRVKRPYKKARRVTAKKYGVSVKHANASASTIQAAVRRALYKHAESKNSQYSGSDYQQIGHNSFINIAPNNLLTTSQGLNDPEGNQNNTNRIGDKISLIKVQFRMMLELNERYSDVTFRILLVKSAKADVPTSSTLFNGLSGNKMLDTLNYERYTVLYEKWGRITSRNAGATTALGGATYTGAGLYNGDTGLAISRATKIIKFNVSGTKFAKDGIIQYEGQNSPQHKFFDYNLLVYAYSNYSTSELLGFNVLAVNDYYHRLVFKDM